jgi:hypothetical protein
VGAPWRKAEWRGISRTSIPPSKADIISHLAMTERLPGTEIEFDKAY